MSPQERPARKVKRANPPRNRTGAGGLYIQPDIWPNRKELAALIAATGAVLTALLAGDIETAATVAGPAFGPWVVAYLTKSRRRG